MMVADIFTALAEDRPYRKGMTKKQIIQILQQFSDRRLLDARIVNLLFDNYEEIHSYVTNKQAITREFYENQFSFLH
jgi:HD-GYP domain-containing protein (c-di-GMP phosphodiesterase class II)